MAKEMAMQNLARILVDQVAASLAVVVSAGLLSLATTQDAHAEPPRGVEVLEAFPDYIQARLETRERQRRLLGRRPGGIGLEFVIDQLTLWDPGHSVSVSFRGGDASLHSKIADVANEWTRYGNATLDFGRDPETGEYRQWSPEDSRYTSEIRISFDQPGYWSLVGRDSVDPAVIGPGEASMNFHGFDRHLPEGWEGTVLHEFGHAFGFHHEHQHPEEGCDEEFRWEDDPDGTPGIYTQLAGPPNYWPKWKVDHNLRQLPPSGHLLLSPHDIRSIMHYSFPAWMFRDGEESRCYTPRNTTLSEGDKLGFARAYPSQPEMIRPLMEQRRTLLDELTASPGKQAAQTIQHFAALAEEMKAPGPRKRATRPKRRKVRPTAPKAPACACEAAAPAKAEAVSRFAIHDAVFPSKQEFINRGFRCATPIPSAFEQTRVRGHLREFRRRNAQFLAQQIEIVIPVQFHVITDADGAGNVPDDKLDDQLNVLNEAYASHGVRFTKAGVRRISNSRWFRMTPNSSAEREAKQQLNVDPTRTLNFYTAGPGRGLLGWATFPWWLAGDPDKDGVVVLFSSLPGGTAVPFNEGDTAVHEVGHWLGLYHTFQGGCTPPGDEVDDTPAEASPASGCPLGRDSCSEQGGQDPVKNFMDYSDDPCMDHFTQDQAARIHQMVGSYRPLLISSERRRSMIPIETE
jgi:hypothetical protein